MKEGWTYKKLGEVGTFYRGINFAKSDFVKDGFPCIHYGQIHTTFGPVTYEHLSCIPREMVKDDKLASKGNLIIAITSEDVEASCKCTTWMGDYDIAVGAHAAIYKHQLNPIFVSYFFKSPVFQKEKEQYVHGFKVMEIKPSDIAKISIPVLSEQEQQAIVSRLDSAFAQIDLLKANAEKQLEEARKLFQAELTEAMKPKEGWEEKTLKEVSIISGDYGLSVSSKPFDSVRYLRITDITDWGELNDDKVSANIDNNKTQEELEEGDILFARTGATVGKTLVYRKDFGECLYAGYLIRYRLNKEKVLPRFMHYRTHSKEYYDWVFINQEAAAQPNISAKKYNLLSVCFPSISEQQKIVSRLDALSANVKKLEELQQKTLAECDALKQAMLREVFE